MFINSRHWNSSGKAWLMSLFIPFPLEMRLKQGGDDGKVENRNPTMAKLRAKLDGVLADPFESVVPLAIHVEEELVVFP